MGKCVDKSVGRFLHDYEMGWLSEEDHERFELHLMDCKCCFDQVREFRHAASLLATDEEVRAAFRSSGRVAGFWSRLFRYLWPEGNLFMKPALAYLCILILLPIALTGLFDRASEDGLARPVRTLELVSTRGALQTVQMDEGKDLVLNFGFAGAMPERQYRVILKSPGGDILFEQHDLTFDIRQSARLYVPFSILSSGEHTVIIQDPQDSSPMGTDTLRFLIDD